MSQEYLKTLLHALTVIEEAKDEILPLLNSELHKQHWIAAKHAPDPWNRVRHWYRIQPDYDDATSDALEAVVALSVCQETLHSTLAQHKPRSGNLKLPKVRRSQ